MKTFCLNVFTFSGLIQSCDKFLITNVEKISRRYFIQNPLCICRAFINHIHIRYINIHVNLYGFLVARSDSYGNNESDSSTHGESRNIDPIIDISRCIIIKCVERSAIVISGDENNT